MKETELIVKVQEAITRYMKDLDDDDTSIDADIFRGLVYNEPNKLLSSLRDAVDGKRVSHGTVIALLFFTLQVIISLKALDEPEFSKEPTVH